MGSHISAPAKFAILAVAQNVTFLGTENFATPPSKNNNKYLHISHIAILLLYINISITIEISVYFV